MTLVGLWKAVAKPVLGLMRHIGRGLSIIGLSLHGRPYQSAGTAFADADADDAVDAAPDPAAAPVPPPRPAQAPPRLRDNVPSARSLTPDEQLWQAELEDG